MACVSYFTWWIWIYPHRGEKCIKLSLLLSLTRIKEIFPKKFASKSQIILRVHWSNIYDFLLQVGPVLSISHGMGVPSIGILLHEIIKLMYHAKCKDPVFIRLGTCGGVGIEGGTVVVSDEAVDGLLRNTYEMVRNFEQHINHRAFYSCKFGRVWKFQLFCW